jgi:hypothetical protein
MPLLRAHAGLDSTDLFAKSILMPPPVPSALPSDVIAAIKNAASVPVYDISGEHHFAGTLLKCDTLRIAAGARLVFDRADAPFVALAVRRVEFSASPAAPCHIGFPAGLAARNGPAGGSPWPAPDTRTEGALGAMGSPGGTGSPGQTVNLPAVYFIAGEIIESSETPSASLPLSFDFSGLPGGPGGAGGSGGSGGTGGPGKAGKEDRIVFGITACVVPATSGGPGGPGGSGGAGGPGGRGGGGADLFIAAPSATLARLRTAQIHQAGGVGGPGGSPGAGGRGGGGGPGGAGNGTCSPGPHGPPGSTGPHGTPGAFGQPGASGRLSIEELPSLAALF